MSHPSPPSAPPSARLLAALILGPVSWTVQAQLVERIPLAPGEGLLLRWLRALGEHPLRGSLALTLGMLALLWPRPRGCPETPPTPETTFL